MSAQYEQITSDLENGSDDAFNGVCELWGKRDPKAGDNPGALIVWPRRSTSGSGPAFRIRPAPLAYSS